MNAAQPYRDPFGVGVDSFNRMEVILRNSLHMDRHAWFTQLGQGWDMCDNIGLWRSALRPYLVTASREELDLMMNEEELEAFKALPSRLTIWRGCYSLNRAGLSWTLDRSVAAGIVRLNRYRRSGEMPLLRQAYAKRDKTVLKLARQEQEVIALFPYSIVETAMPAADAFSEGSAD